MQVHINCLFSSFKMGLGPVMKSGDRIDPTATRIDRSRRAPTGTKRTGNGRKEQDK